MPLCLPMNMQIKLYFECVLFFGKKKKKIPVYGSKRTINALNKYFLNLDMDTNQS